MTADRYLVISSDSHAGLPTEQYREYLDPEASSPPSTTDRDATSSARAPPSGPQRGVRQDSGSRSTTRLAGGWDAIRRDQALDGDGVAGEVVYPDADAVESRTCAPFGAGLGPTGRPDPELGIGGREGAQPLARRAVLAQPGAPRAASPSCRSRADSTTARRDPPRQGRRPRRGDDPGDVVPISAVPRPPLRPRVGAVRGAARCRW